ncbi:hypothetical protein AJ80_09303 [Polytolypa hystricis UAMH7299]|uniref:Protein kinase domain-containing protein n=1 Tax=Polytolypa hystricis (strain UAMH7299) TaxID=1447883 RepID=A0A2B7WSX3_POLH7|nr:hypothetical protein AJ80_09303 [Polytolypa hystricis UAMH7299]
MSSRRSDRPLTQFAMQDFLSRTKPPPDGSEQMGERRLAQPGQPGKRTLTRNPETHRKIMRGPVKDLVLGEASQSGGALGDTFIIRRESPWETFKKIYECELAGRFDVAIPHVRPERLVAIRTIRAENIDRMLHLYQRIQHPNILCPQECFLHEGSAFALHDDIPISLDHIIACEAYLDEVELATILVQILDGLLYLTDQRIEHRRLSSSNVLVTGRGEVKIAGLHECVELQADHTPRYSKPLEVITMELMQKYEKEDNRIGVDDVERWPCDSYAIGFLSSIETEASVRELREKLVSLELSNKAY